MASQDRTNTTDDRKIATEQSADDRLNQLEQAALQVAQNDSAGEPVPVDPAAGQPIETSAAPDVPETVTPDADNIVRLPEGVSIDEIKLDGDNLILVQPDGSSITILNAALRIPTFLIGDVEIPELALTAALQANGIDVAAGPDGALTVVSATSQSGGGNFTTPNAGIGDAGPVIDLLPPTALQFGALERRELFPALREDRENDIPELSIVSIGTPPGEVNESALASGSGGGTTATAGNILVDPGNDGLASLVVTNVDGLSVDVTGGGRVDGTYGTLFVTPNGDGTYRFEYVLSQNTTDHDGPGKTGGDDVVRDVFKFVVTDGNGDTATDNLTITITDDGPIAVDDTDTIAAGAFGPVAGNLITDAEANGDNGADTPGADGASVSSVIATTAEGPASAVGTDTVVEGLYGVLTISADGSYSYARNPGTAGGVQDVFTYTLKDGDGDTDTATLTIDIGDASVEIRTPGVEEDGTIVFERGLPERGAEPAGSGESADGDGTDNDDPSEATSGTVTFTAPDGVQSVSVAGTALALGDPFPQTVSSDATGTLVVTGYSYNAVTGQGSISYSYTLTDNTLADPDGVSFGVTVTDADGDSQSGTIDIAIIDDAPVAVADTDSIGAGQFGPAAGNVITDAEGDGGADTVGADDASVVGVAAGNTGADLDNAGTVGTVIQGAYGKLTLNADGSYSYTRDAGTAGGVSDVFTYTLKDGDGDLTHTTLTIDIGNAPPEIGNLTPKADGGDVAVDEDDLAAGRGGGKPAGSDGSDSTTQSGTFTVSSPDGIASLTIGGQSFITNGVFTAGSVTTGLGNTLNVTGYDAGTGVVSYSYTLVDNETHGTGAGENDLFEDFAVVLTDQDGQSANDVLSVKTVDDVPEAMADTDSIGAGQFGPAAGNVITDAEGDGGADTVGADDASVVGVAAGNTGADLDNAGTVGTVIQGAYGKLTLNADGSYSYTRDAGTAGGVSDVFTYTLKDGDGDLTHTTLTIDIGNAPPEIGNLTPKADGGDVAVDEDDLAAGRGGGKPAGSDGSDSTTQSGTFTVSSPDGIASLTIGGQSFITNGVFTAGSVTTGLGNTLNVTGYDAGTGVVSYSYTLVDNETHGTGAGENDLFEDFAVVLTDQDGQSANDVLSVKIVDDVPEAMADTDSIGAGQFGPAAGNVITDAEGDGGADTVGADDASVVGVAAGNTGADLDNAGTVGTVIQGAYGKLTLNADGSYSYTRDAGTAGGVSDVFTYTLKDGDGDLTHTTLTIDIGNAPPEIGNLTPKADGGDVAVDEDDLAAGRGGGKPAGSDGSDSTTQSGTFTISSPDGIASLTIGGQSFITNGVFTAGSVTTGLGNTLNVTGYDAGTGVVSYSYTLVDNETHGAGAGENDLFEDFAVVLTDQDGQSANDVLSVKIVDDVPEAMADTDSIGAGQFGPATGNVITDAEGDGGADTVGADDASVVGVAAGNTGADLDNAGTVGTVIQGAYGKLTLNANGSYSYTRDAGTKGGVSDVFTYTLKDGDGDLTHTTLTIDIGDSGVTVTTPQPGDDGTTVHEKGLAERGAEPAGSGESADGDGTNNDDPSEATSGTVTFTAPDGVQSVSVAGTALALGDPFPQTVSSDATGTLVVTGYSYNAVTGQGSISYSYTLTDNTLADPDGVSFGVTVTDADGDSQSGTIDIAIIDDAPVAVADTDSIGAGQFGPAAGNVITDAEGDGGADTVGADDASVVGVAAGNTGADLDNAGTVGTVIQGAYGKLTLNADGSYSYTRDAGTAGGVSDVFTYTLKDGDGDLTHTTLTIDIGNAPPEIGNLTPKADGGDVAVDEDDLAAGRGGGKPAGSDGSDSTTQSGTFTISSPDGIASLTIGGQSFITNGVFTAGSVTTGLGNTLNVTGYDAGTGVVSYSYTLVDNETHGAGAGENDLFEDFAVVLTDQDGQSANDVLSVKVVDDVPEAMADTDSIGAGQFGPATGNVITDAEGDGGADTVGADDASVVGVAAGDTGADLDNAGTVGTVIQGTYGKLTLNADGSYSYTRDAGTAGGVQDVFTYTLKDGDGDLTHTTLTIDIGNAPPEIGNLTPKADGGDVAVDEDDLAAGRGGGKPAGSDGSDSTTQSGTFTISSPDGIASLTIGGQSFITNGVFTAGSVTTGLGNTLNVTGYDAGTGVVSYSYTLVDNEAHGTGAGENDLFEDFAVVLTDQDGQSANDVLSVKIVDDIPEAMADTDSAIEGGIADGNVLTGSGGSDANATDGVADIQGADGATVTSIVATTAGGSATNVGTNTVVNGQYGTLTISSDGSYSYQSTPGAVASGTVQDVFTYTITDADGDPSTTTLTINVNDSGLATPDYTVTVNEAALDLNKDGDDLVPGTVTGSLPGSTDETSGGTASATGGTGPYTYALQTGGNAVTAGTYGSIQVNSDGTYTYTLSSNYLNATADDGVQTISGAESFTYVATDAFGNTTTGTISIDIIDDVPKAEAAAGETASVVLDESDGSGSGTDGINPGQIQAGDIQGLFATPDFGADGAGSVAYSFSATDGAATGLWLTGQSGAANEIILVKVSDTVYEGRAGGGVGTPAFTVSINGATGAVTVTQHETLEHTVDGGPGAAHDDALFLGGAAAISVVQTVTDADGDTATATSASALSIRFDDDGPTAKPDTASLTLGTESFNIAFVLDFSGSVSNSELDQMLDAVKAAGQAFFSGTTGDVQIELVAFSSSALSAPGPFTDYASFAAQIDAWNPAEGGSRPYNGGTDFTAAIEETMATYTPLADYNNQVFFLSDGNPNEQIGAGGHSLLGSTQTAWNNFVQDNDVTVQTVGIGNNIDVEQLQDVDEADGDNTVVSVSNFDDLVEALLDLANQVNVSGNVLLGDDNAAGGGDDDGFGADGGRILSVKVDGVTYTYDPDADQITNDGGEPVQAGSGLEVDTPLGGVLELDFNTGAWDYQANSGTTAGTETFDYVIIDNDGDTSTTQLTVNVLPPPEIVDDLVLTNITDYSAISIPTQALLHNDDGKGAPLHVAAVDNAQDGSVSLPDDVVFTPSNTPASFVDEDFSAGLGGFTYEDNHYSDRYYQTTGSDASGQRETGGIANDGALALYLGGNNGTNRENMNGAFTRSFNLASTTTVTITFDYYAFLSGQSDNTDDVWVLADVDGNAFGAGGVIDELIGSSSSNSDHQSTGWQTFSTTLTLSAGEHTLSLGGLMTSKEQGNEYADVYFDNVSVEYDPTPAFSSGGFDYTASTGEASVDGHVTVTGVSGSVITGTSADEVLVGNDSGSTLLGMGGDDALIGGDGDDLLIGGEGADLLIGGEGQNTYDLTDIDNAEDTVVLDQSALAGLDPDAIIGFGSEDVVDLTELVSIGPGDNVADYVRLNPGNSTQLQVDADGTAGSEDWVTVATFDVPQTPSTIKILYEDDGSDNSGTV
ncbi:VCBS repeat-containing protein [Nitratireductor aquibiodomus]|uniref:VCBS repeat-containing protein n=1 Tax=Nitratireductor aquibiodomus TaxID=204799 RepID=A0A1H4LX90_9HYPH|nr:DUF5801 repeats-in-toxin domain-containing protein [Nitratireductor aquibiodomus]SEB75124.1 VCBS repeat-containing protein [Nitratireductor aquibiodomus]